MIEGARWRKWTYFYAPLGLFIISLLFPFYWMVITTVRPDRELYRPWNAPNYAPFWTTNPTFSVFNWLFWKLHFINSRINWLGDPDLAMTSISIVNIWRGVPFYAISLLAGLQTISPDLHEAAAIDGANRFQRFWYVTWPLLLPVTMVVVLFSVIQTFADFQLVYVLTGGGPANATHLFATYAYQIGIGTGLLSEGAAISLAMFPALLLVVVFQLWYIRRVENR